MARRNDGRPAKRGACARLTDARKQVFLEELSKHGVFARAARQASPGRPTGAVVTFREEAKRNPEFAALIAEALEVFDGELLMELHRRGVEGVLTDVRGPSGQVVGQYRKVSDRLLVEKLRSRFPREFASHTVSEVTAKVASTSLDLDKLSPESQDQLRAILEREAARGAEPYSALPMGEREA